MSNIKSVKVQPSSIKDSWQIIGDTHVGESVVRVALSDMDEDTALVKAAEFAQEHGLDRVYYAPVGLALKRFWVDVILEVVR